MTDYVGNGKGPVGLEALGIRPQRDVYWNVIVPELYEHVARRNEGLVASGGPLVVNTGTHTGRSPRDKFIVCEPSSEGNIDWGAVNQPFDPEKFDALCARVIEHLSQRDLFIEDLFANADQRYRLSIRYVMESAWQAMFLRNLFIRPTTSQLANFAPQFSVLGAPSFEAVPERDGTRSKTFIVVNFAKRIVLIGGTSYAGENKKCIFSVLNYLLPLQGVLPMHCSANVGHDGQSALFFGLSGTGKTTLSADPTRTLIGDDEHGWSDHGIFNFEGGCYAKVINLSASSEPEIHAATNRFGTVLENVVINPHNRRVNFDDDSLTENTRSAYPLAYIPNATMSGVGPHPRNVVFLTADAFGVLPPISRLTLEQASFHFLSGYTAKVAGTEKGVTEPQATFSACFAAPFLVHKPQVYADMLVERLRKHNANCWLINTGWTGGPYGVGARMKLSYTREMVRAALEGDLDSAPFQPDPIFGLNVPERCNGVPRELLNPRNTWLDKDAYDAKARELRGRIAANYERLMTQGASARTPAG
ncbi:MAG: phosphoenolpyruvate carboxykinase (ATP) [Chloroflexi bacterium]|nr:phosphoenolpyruvate carboxykinase (ATP) [Chloroflexota bacterium]